MELRLVEDFYCLALPNTVTTGETGREEVKQTAPIYKKLKKKINAVNDLRR